jgi:hypothetical protein
MDEDRYLEYPLNYEEIVARQLELLENDYQETLKCNFGEKIDNEEEQSEVNNYECLDESVEEDVEYIAEKENQVVEEIEIEELPKIEEEVELEKTDIKVFSKIDAEKIKEKMKNIQPIIVEEKLTDEELIIKLKKLNFTS